MTFLRRRLRVWVTAWLFCQVASLSALAPRQCCAAHESAGAATHGHTTAATPHCPMPAADRTPCPTHTGQGERRESQPTGQCSLRGTCQGPSAALLTLLSNRGILPGSITVLPHAEVRPFLSDHRQDVTGHVEPPESPPPRA